MLIRNNLPSSLQLPERFFFYGKVLSFHYFAWHGRNENIYLVNHLNYKVNQTANAQIYYSPVNKHLTCLSRVIMVLMSILHMANSPCGTDPSDTHLFLMHLFVSPSTSFRINVLSKMN